MKNEKIKLVVNTFYPIIILLCVILVTDNQLVIILVSWLTSMYLNYILFEEEYKSIKDEIYRVFYINLIILLSTYAFSNIPTNLCVIGNAKLGYYLGFFLDCGLIIYLKNRYKIEIIEISFDLSKNKFSSVELLSFLIKMLGVFLLVVVFVSFFAPSFAFKCFNLSTFLFVLIPTYFYAARYSVFNKEVRDSLTNKYRLGLFLIFFSLFFLWEHHFIVLYFWKNSSIILALICLITGISYVQLVTIKAKSSHQKKMLKKFTYPSIIMLVCMLGISIFFGVDFESSSKNMISESEILIYNSIAKDKNNIEKDIQQLFVDLKQSNRLVAEIEPVIDIRLRINTNWLLIREMELVGDFSYNYEDVLIDSIKHYKPGRYRLKDSDISLAIVQSFEMSVYNYFQSYFEAGTNVEIQLFGAADAIPFLERSKTIYKGEYGDVLNYIGYSETENKYEDIIIQKSDKLTNSSLALLRSLGIKYYIEQSISILENTNLNYSYSIFVEPKNKGAEYRKVRVKIIISDIDISK